MKLKTRHANTLKASGQYPINLYVPQEKHEELKCKELISVMLESDYGFIEFRHDCFLTVQHHKALVYILFSNVFKKYGGYGPSLDYETDWLNSKEEHRTRRFTVPQIIEDLEKFDYMKGIIITKTWLLKRLEELRDYSFLIIPKNRIDKHLEFKTNILNSVTTENDRIEVVFNAVFSQLWESIWIFY